MIGGKERKIAGSEKRPERFACKRLNGKFLGEVSILLVARGCLANERKIRHRTVFKRREIPRAINRPPLLYFNRLHRSDEK